MNAEINEMEVLVIGEDDMYTSLYESLSSLNYQYLACSLDEFDALSDFDDLKPGVIFVADSNLDNEKIDGFLKSRKIKQVIINSNQDAKQDQRTRGEISYPFNKADVRFVVETNLIENRLEEKLKSQMAHVDEIMMQLTHSNVKGLLLSEAMKKFMQAEKLISKQGGLRKLLVEYLSSLMDVTNFSKALFVRLRKNGECKRIFDVHKTVDIEENELTKFICEYSRKVFNDYQNIGSAEPQIFNTMLNTDEDDAAIYVIPIRSRKTVYGLTVLVCENVSSIDGENIDNDVIKFLSMEVEQIIERYLLNQEISNHNKAFKEANERLEYVLSSSPAVLFSLNSNNYSLKFISKNVEQFLGYPPELLTSNVEFFWKLIHPDDANKTLSEFKKVLTKGRCVREYRLRCADGKYKWVHDELRLLRRNTNQSEISGYFVDISEQVETQIALRKSNIELKSAYDSLQKAKNQLLQSEKMASIGQLAAGVAHEINNPVGYISSNLSSLTQYVNDLFSIIKSYENFCDESSPAYQNVAVVNKIKDELDINFIRSDLPDLLEQSQEGVARVKKIVQDLKDFSHVDSSDWELADLHQGIDSTLNIVNNEIKYKAEVIKDYGEIPRVECIASQLNQVFMNMAVNAAHAIEERGTITIQTRQINDHVEIRFLDTGSGIEEKNIKKLFDPFFTTKPVGKGTGLGLSLSFSIIEKHNGKIEIESEVGKGTTFIISVPIKQTHETHEKVA